MNNDISHGLVLSNDISIISAIENYKTTIDLHSVEMFEKYIEVVSKYIAYFRNTITVSNNIEYYKYILIKGINTICHVFRILFLYTKNIDLVIHHCEKSFFYYIEFIRQIDENNHNLLSLNSNDATYFVFKKTIYEINHEYRKNFNSLEDDNINVINNRKINNANIVIDVYNHLLIKVIHSTVFLQTSANVENKNKNNNASSFSYINTKNEDAQIVSFENKMNKLSSIIIQYLRGENENDDRFIELLNVMESFVYNYKNSNKCIVPYIEALLKKIKKIVGDSNNKLINSSEILDEISKRIKTTGFFIENDEDICINNTNNSLSPSKYINLLIRK